jgi:hypothetical protein
MGVDTIQDVHYFRARFEAAGHQVMMVIDTPVIRKTRTE